MLSRVAWSLLSLVALSACSMGPPDDPPVGRAEDAIINGARDTKHPAVVALILGENSWGGACSGTIVKTDPKRRVGWVATAAHCVEPGVSLVIQAENYWSGDAVTYPVIDYEADRRFSQQLSDGYDFAMVRIGGVDESTPVIPLATAPDGLSLGMRVTSVGYGVTHDGPTSQRHYVEKPIADLTGTLIGYDQSESGVCFGDSGGPVIAGSGASARVVGIHSFVTFSENRDCMGSGYSARVTSGLDFFDKELEKALPEPTCELCEKIATGGAGSCASLTGACLENENCRGYYECLANGKKQSECLSEFPAAEGLVTAAQSCVCVEACPEECGGTKACARVGTCGYAFEDEDDECGACIESSCCEEARDCTADVPCYDCLKSGDEFGICKRNKPRKSLAACALDQCATECEGSTILTIGEEPSPKESDAPPPTAPAKEDGGCSSAPGPRVAGSAWALLAAALVVLARRRRTTERRPLM